MFSPRNLFKNFDTSVFLSSTVLNILSCSLFILLALSCCIMFLFVFIVDLLVFMVSSLFCIMFSFFSLILFCSFVLLFLFFSSISSGESGMYFSLTSHSVNSVLCSSSYSSSSSFDNTFFRKTEEISNFKMLF